MPRQLRDGALLVLRDTDGVAADRKGKSKASAHLLGGMLSPNSDEYREWKEFPEGASPPSLLTLTRYDFAHAGVYTYPILFSIPGNMPPTFSCAMLRHTVLSSMGNIIVSHTLKIILRVSMDGKMTGEVKVHMPVHILSVCYLFCY
jgi:hypothetical protein